MSRFERVMSFSNMPGFTTVTFGESPLLHAAKWCKLIVQPIFCRLTYAYEYDFIPVLEKSSICSVPFLWVGLVSERF